MQYEQLHSWVLYPWMANMGLDYGRRNSDKTVWPDEEFLKEHLLENARLADLRLAESPLHKIKGLLTPEA